MKKTRHTEEQTASALEQADMGYQRGAQLLPKRWPVRARLVASLEKDQTWPRRGKLCFTRIHDVLLKASSAADWPECEQIYPRIWRHEVIRRAMPADQATAATV